MDAVWTLCVWTDGRCVCVCVDAVWTLCVCVADGRCVCVCVDAVCVWLMDAVCVCG